MEDTTRKCAANSEGFHLYTNKELTHLRMPSTTKFGFVVLACDLSRYCVVADDMHK